MWQIYYVRALEIANERILEAEGERSARLAQAASGRQTRVEWLRGESARAAAGLARRLDECVAQETLAGRTTDDRARSAT